MWFLFSCACVVVFVSGFGWCFWYFLWCLCLAFGVLLVMLIAGFVLVLFACCFVVLRFVFVFFVFLCFAYCGLGELVVLIDDLFLWVWLASLGCCLVTCSDFVSVLVYCCGLFDISGGVCLIAVGVVILLIYAKFAILVFVFNYLLAL